MTLSKIQIRVAPLSNRVVLARFGKDPNVALETRDAMNEFLQTLTSYAFDGKMPEIGASATLEYGGGNEQFEVRITRAALKEREGSSMTGFLATMSEKQKQAAREYQGPDTHGNIVALKGGNDAT